MHHTSMNMKINGFLLGLSVFMLTCHTLYPTASMYTLQEKTQSELSKEFNEDPELQKPKVELHYSGKCTYYITDEENKKISITKIALPKNLFNDELSIPIIIDGYEVAGIGMLFDSFAYYEEKGYPIEEYRIISNEDMNKVKSISLPEGLEQIGTNAFNGMKDLTQVKLPDSLLRIYPDAFSSTGIKELELPINLSYISSHAFYNCNSLIKVTIFSKSPIYSDEYPPFASCDISEVIWGKSVETIDMMGFRLNHLKRMVVPENVKSVDLQACDTLIIKGSKTTIFCSDSYIRDELRKCKIILCKNSAAVKGVKELKCKYIEVSLPQAPIITIKQYTDNKISQIKLSWNKLSEATKYQIYYAKSKNGSYSRIAETEKLSYTLKKKSGYIKIRAYKLYQNEKWYGPFSSSKKLS